MDTAQEGSPTPVVMDGLVRSSFAVMALLTRVAAEHDLSLTQFRALAILRDREPTMGELAAFLGLERSSVSGLIDRSVKRGLARRETSSHDARAVRVGLTVEGQRLAGVVTAQVASLLEPLTGNLTPAEQARLGDLLSKMLA